MDDRTRKALALLDLIEASDDAPEGRTAIHDALARLRVRPTTAAAERGRVARDIMRRVLEMIEHPGPLGQERLEAGRAALNANDAVTDARALIVRRVGVAAESWRFRRIEAPHIDRLTGGAQDPVVLRENELAHELLEELAIIEEPFGKLTPHQVRDALAQAGDARHMTDSNEAGIPPQTFRIAAMLSAECNAFGVDRLTLKDRQAAEPYHRVIESYRYAVKGPKGPKRVRRRAKRTR